MDLEIKIVFLVQIQATIYKINNVCHNASLHTFKIQRLTTAILAILLVPLVLKVIVALLVYHVVLENIFKILHALLVVSN